METAGEWGTSSFDTFRFLLRAESQVRVRAREEGLENRGGDREEFPSSECKRARELKGIVIA